MEHELVLGIDLGTTNSCAAISDTREVRLIEQRGGKRLLPSIVAFRKDDAPLVGELAKRQAATNPEHTIFGMKRLMGKKYDSEEVQQSKKLLPYELVSGPHGEARVRIDSKDYSPQEISALILREIKKITEQYLQKEVKKAVITVPAYFSDSQRQATKDAGTIAGLEVLRIINEPTAAALAFGYKKTTNKKIAVYDLGGGTFDISILEISKDTFEVLATGGDTYLGGEDFDQTLIRHFAEAFQTDHKINILDNRMALQRLKEAAEIAKHELSSRLQTEVHLPFIYSSEGISKHLKMKIHRLDFEKMNAPFIQRTLDICESVLKMASLKAGEIDDVLLVGGMTRMPLIQQKVQEFFGKIPSKNINPDEAVAMGAAILGRSLTFRQGEVFLLDVTPRDLGVRIAGGSMHVIVPRNTIIPTEITKPYTTVRDNQDAVKISIYQGEDNRTEKNTLLGEFRLTPIPPAPAGKPNIEVNFTIDANGLLEVSAKDAATQQKQSIQISSKTELPEDELTELIERYKGQ